MNRLKLVFALPLLALAACGGDVTEVLEVQHFTNQSGDVVSVAYTSSVDGVLMKRNAKNLIASVVIDELDDIGFARSDRATMASKSVVGCDMTIAFDKHLDIASSATCRRGEETFEFGGAVFHSIELLVNDAEPSASAD